MVRSYTQHYDRSFHAPIVVFTFPSLSFKNSHAMSLQQMQQFDLLTISC